MNNILDALEKELKMTPDYGIADREWNVVLRVIEMSPESKEKILECVFAEWIGYVETRTWAGLALFKVNPERVLTILENLFCSSDPDNRDTALSVLKEINHPELAYLAKPLLTDPYPYLRLEAEEFLK